MQAFGIHDSSIIAECLHWPYRPESATVYVGFRQTDLLLRVSFRSEADTPFPHPPDHRAVARRRIVTTTAHAIIVHPDRRCSFSLSLRTSHCSHFGPAASWSSVSFGVDDARRITSEPIAATNAGNVRPSAAKLWNHCTGRS